MCKGPDRVTVGIRSHRFKDDMTDAVREVSTIDEILAYQDALYFGIRSSLETTLSCYG